MTSIETVNVNDETKRDEREAFASLRESPMKNEVVEQHETVNEECEAFALLREPKPEEPKEETTPESAEEREAFACYANLNQKQKHKHYQG